MVTSIAITPASLLGVADACSPPIRHMLACARDELTRVGLFDAENLRNLFIRVASGRRPRHLINWKQWRGTIRSRIDPPHADGTVV